jgi:hypothetical protein
MAIWQDYGNRAIRDLYPLLRDGVDYKWGTREEGTPASLLGDNTGDIDVSVVEARANRLMGEDPYSDYDAAAPAKPPMPKLNALEPNTAAMGSADFEINLRGVNFTAQSVILWNNGEESTTFVDASTLTTTVKPSTVSAPVTIPIQVRDGQLVSNGLPFTFTEAEEPPPLEE